VVPGSGAVSAALVSAGGGVTGAASAGVVAGVVSAGAPGVSVAAGAGAGSGIADAAGWASVAVGVAGAVSAGAVTAGVVSAGAVAGVVSAGALGGSATTGATTAGAACGAGITGFAGATGCAAGTVLDLVVAAGAVCRAAALVALVADLPGPAAGLSNSFIFCSKAARAAAWTGVSSARTEMKLAQKAAAQTAGNNFMICISFFYANLSPDATAFPRTENNFCHTPGSG
jgi:hypothetical protein